MEAKEEDMEAKEADMGQDIMEHLGQDTMEDPGAHQAAAPCMALLVIIAAEGNRAPRMRTRQ